MFETPRLEAEKWLPMFPKGDADYFFCTQEGTQNDIWLFQLGAKAVLEKRAPLNPLTYNRGSFLVVFFVNHHSLKAELSSFFI